MRKITDITNEVSEHYKGQIDALNLGDTTLDLIVRSIVNSAIIDAAIETQKLITTELKQIEQNLTRERK